VAVQRDTFPPTLLSLAGELALHLVVSVYPISSEESQDT
jgi:hypothetical protein